jgi:response regulator RpfG family c-di-GMP phosphodiesterase
MGYALREIIAKTNTAEEQAKIYALKRKSLEGGLVPAGELDRAMAEQALLHKSDKLHDESTLPQLLEGKSISEIRDIMRTHHTKRLNRLDELINKQYNSKLSLHDLVEAISTKLTAGATLENILRAINAQL